VAVEEAVFLAWALQQQQEAADAPLLLPQRMVGKDFKTY